MTLTDDECRAILNTQPSWNLGPFALIRLGYDAGRHAALTEAEQACEEWDSAYAAGKAIRALRDKEQA